MDIQGYIVEKLSGQSLPDFMRDHIFAPLGMKDAGFFVPADKRSRFATLYENDGHGGLQLDSSNGSGLGRFSPAPTGLPAAAAWFRPPRTTTASRRCSATAASSAAPAFLRRRLSGS